ncbi:MAG: hypothetical protein AAGJ37_15055 [Pseudomonadota bacterium]
MKTNMILEQNIPFASLINSALDLCKVMLSKSTTLYPFAVVSIDNDVQCVFTATQEQEARAGMIEELEQQLSYRRLMAKDAVGILVYAATVAEPGRQNSSALVFSITDSGGKNTVTVYPYEQSKSAISLGRPFTCDFSD